MVWLALLVACFPDPEPGTGDPCVGCHGSEELGPAPPVALGGFESESNLGVGAHQAHVNDATLSAKVACSECHSWPDTVDAEGHTDTPWPAEVMWGELAKTDGGAQPWDRETGTCTVYCHGSTLTGGLHTTPDWTSTDGSQVVCGSCHGNPPPPPHAQNGACADCHGAMTPDHHMNGVVDCWNEEVDGTTGATARSATTGATTEPGSCDDLPCSLCHGTDQSAAPPPDVMGNTDKSARGVGAHDVHLAGTGLSDPVGCWTCHTETHGTSDVGHIDLGPAEVVLGGLAAASGYEPGYDPDNLTCAVRCHDVRGGTQPLPVWTAEWNPPGNCTNCHGLPPPSPHPANAACGSCHPAQTPGVHMNGQVDF